MARPVYIIDGSRTPFLKARSGPGTVHAGRSRRAMRPAAAGAAAVRARRVRSGHPRLRQCHRRRDEPGPRRRAAARHGRGDGGVHGADQLRLRHAVDRHRLPLHPRGQRRPDPGRRRGSAEPRAAGLAAAGRALVRRARRRQGHRWRSSRRSPKRGPSYLQADHRARARADRSDHRPQHGPDRRNGRPSVRHHPRAVRCLCRRKPQAARATRRRKAGSRARSKPPSRATASSTITTTACGRIPRPRSWRS